MHRAFCIVSTCAIDASHYRGIDTKASNFYALSLRRALAIIGTGKHVDAAGSGCFGD
ncbi:MAG: hypothetical protein GY813_17285 [Halieaceae bacterium]|nr:hypothetical protein [Halieaceae bacterium]